MLSGYHSFRCLNSRPKVAIFILTIETTNLFIWRDWPYAPHDPTGRFNLNVRSSREAVS